MFTTAMLTALLLKLKAAVISGVIGYAMKFVVGQITSGLPKLWAKIPASVQPYASTVLGAAAAAVNAAGDGGVGLAVDVVSGALGGAAAKVTHDGDKATAAEKQAADRPALFRGGSE